MDAAEHVLDQAAQHAPVAGDSKSYVRDDGTIVIDILAPSCGPANGREIVVCAPGEEHRLNASKPMAHQAFRPVIQLGGNATANVHAESGLFGAARAVVELKVKF